MRALLRNVGRVTVCQVVGNLEFATRMKVTPVVATASS